jgi:multidrug efflux pump subunit AcrB
MSVAMLWSGHLKFQSFPDVDGDTVMARVLLPQGTPLEQTEAVVARITAGIETVNDALQPAQPSGERLVRNVSVQYNFNPDAGEIGPHLATVTVDLLGAEQRNARVDDLLNRWRAEVGTLPDVLSVKYGEPTVGPAGLPIDIRLYGDELDGLKAASLELQAWLNQFEGVLDVSDDLRLGKPEVQVRLREGATGLGLTAEQLASQLRAAFFGSTAAELQVGDEAYEVDVRLAAGDRDSLGDLEAFHVTLPSGQQVPLSVVAHLDEGRGYARIVRVDGQRAVTVQGDVDTSVLNTAELMAALEAEFVPTLAERFPRVELSVEGEAKETATTGRSLSRGLLIGLIGVFVLLSFQFKSYVEPFTVMTAIPMAFIGVVWGHLLMGFDLTMPSMVGFASLAGIVVNDSILLVEFIKLREREGKTSIEAARQASRDRFRAVLLTSLTTIAGLLPLLAERSMQAQFLIPLTASIVFGLMASTVLVLVVVPCLYGMVSDLRA